MNRLFSQHQMFARAAAMCSLALLVTACTSPPPAGSTGGRIDPYRTTAADRASGAASVPALLEFSDVTAQALARDLCDIPALANSSQKLVLELGDLNNQTATPTSDFRMMQNRVRNQLLKSQLIQSKFIVVADPARMDSEMGRVSGQSGAGSARYDPSITYMLLGDFFEATRGHTRRYYFTFSLVNLASRQIAFQKDYDLGQQ